MLYNNSDATNKVAKGNVTFNRNIILSVVNLAAKEISGVSSLVANFGSALKRWFGKNYYEGVNLTNNNGKLSVDVYLNVYFGYNVSEISYRVQENIKNSLSSMIDVEIDKVNVHVLGVDFIKEEEDKN